MKKLAILKHFLQLDGDWRVDYAELYDNLTEE